MKKIILFLWLISLVLYLITPLNFSYEYCWLLFIINLCGWNILFRIASFKNALNFNSFFFICSLLVSFVFPLFIYPNEWLIFTFRYYYDSKYIVKGTALFNLAMLSYISGFVYTFRPKKVVAYVYILDRKLLGFLYFIFYAMVSYGIWDLSKQTELEYSEVTRASITHYSITLLLCILVILNCSVNKEAIKGNIKSFLVYNMPLFIPSAIFSFFCLLVGVRYPVLEIMLIIGYSFSFFVHNLKVRHVLTLGTLGLFLMFAVSILRMSGDLSAPMNFWLFFSDLIGTTKNLYLGLDYIDRNGYNYGQSLVAPLTSFFPFLPSFLTDLLFNKPPSQLGSQLILTQFNESVNPNMGFWVGSNVAIDLYLDFGFIWVCFVMFLFGKYIAFLESTKGSSLLYNLLYTSAFSYCIFLVRASVFDQIRSIIWILFFYTLIRFTNLIRIHRV